MRLPLPLIAAVFISAAYASSGDRSGEFGSCLLKCGADRCPTDGVLHAPLALWLTRWTCLDNCKYECMHAITDRQVQNGERVHQYYGKWPFWRFAGMQEPASVAFSFLNLWAHFKGAQKIRRKVFSRHPMRNYYLLWSFCSMNAWAWSSIFHTRDIPLTEKLDYFSAALAILNALYYTILRLFHPYFNPSGLTFGTQSNKSLKRRFLAAICILIYVAHISYLTLLPRFDYTYNMAFNITLGMVHNFLWVLYALPASRSCLQRFPNRPNSYRPGFVGKAAVFVALTTAAIGLELFDFPPVGRIIDAHSLWHLSTFPIALLWYDFLIEDSCDPSWREKL